MYNNNTALNLGWLRQNTEGCWKLGRWMEISLLLLLSMNEQKIYFEEQKKEERMKFMIISIKGRKGKCTNFYSSHTNFLSFFLSFLPWLFFIGLFTFLKFQDGNLRVQFSSLQKNRSYKRCCVVEFIYSLLIQLKSIFFPSIF